MNPAETWERWIHKPLVGEEDVSCQARSFTWIKNPPLIFHQVPLKSVKTESQLDSRNPWLTPRPFPQQTIQETKFPALRFLLRFLCPLVPQVSSASRIERRGRSCSVRSVCACPGAEPKITTWRSQGPSSSARPRWKWRQKGGVAFAEAEPGRHLAMGQNPVTSVNSPTPTKKN